jgi:PLP dependent protein
VSLLQVKKQIAAYERKYRRLPHSVHLLAVSKQQSVDRIAQVFAAGQRSFGESYLQEALLKKSLLLERDVIYQQIEWHFIGSIQRNKTRLIAEHFAWAHSVTHQSIAQRLDEQRPVGQPPLNICIQVHLSDEPTKSGVQLDEVHPLATYCLTRPRLRLRGLMGIPMATKHLATQRAQLRPLFLLWQQLIAQGLPLDTLSMGMSNDLEAAIAEGATMVRIGTALFGPRIKHH